MLRRDSTPEETAWLDGIGVRPAYASVPAAAEPVVPPENLIVNFTATAAQAVNSTPGAAAGCAGRVLTVAGRVRVSEKLRLPSSLLSGL